MSLSILAKKKDIMVSIGPKAEDRPNRNPHNKVVKDTISKFACIRSAPAALDLSS